MEGALVNQEQATPSASLARAREYISQAKAPATVKAYRSDWRDFAAWCKQHGLQALPAAPETLAAYLADRAATRRVSTLQRRISAVSQAHAMKGGPNPTKSEAVRLTMKGIRRSLGTKPEEKAPVYTADLRAMVATLQGDLSGLRDRALLLLGFAGALRRSELVGLDAADVEFHPEGAVITLPRSKTDQEAAGVRRAIPYGRHAETCPVLALQAWLEAAGITEGSMFRGVNRHGQLQPRRLSDRAVALVVTRAAEAAGLDAERYGGHSLRAGLATSAAAAGVPERDIMRQTGHKSVQMVRRYIREGELFRNNAAAQVGL